MHLCAQSYPQPPVDSVDKCLARLKQGLFLGDKFGTILPEIIPMISRSNRAKIKPDKLLGCIGER